MRSSLPWAALLILLAGCGGNEREDPRAVPVALEERGRALAQTLLLVDTHIDVPDRLHREPADVAQRTAGGHFDWPRAREGGLDAAFFSIYVPTGVQDEGRARTYADELIDLVERIASGAADKFALARSPDEVRAIARSGRMALALGIENGAAIENDLANLAHFHARGVRYVTLTHGKNNAIGDSSYDTERRWHGLSPFGRDVVREMNRLGMLIDVSHVSDETARAVLELTRSPVIASHSSCRALTPDFERNLSDELIRGIATGGGVVQINFGSAFLTAEAQRAALASWHAIADHLREMGWSDTSPGAKAWAETYQREHPVPATSIDDVVAHVEHVVRLVGVDHVGFGSDFDGVSELPRGLEDVSAYPRLLAALLARGYDEEDLRKIAGENLLRVWSEAERRAAQSASRSAG